MIKRLLGLTSRKIPPGMEHGDGEQGVSRPKAADYAFGAVQTQDSAQDWFTKRDCERVRFRGLAGL